MNEDVEDVKTLFPSELEEMLSFEEVGEYIVVRPRRFLGSDNFAKIASIVRQAGGEYVSLGKKSHFKIPKNKAQSEAPSSKEEWIRRLTKIRDLAQGIIDELKVK